jgi:hypothetical protein
MVRIITNTFVLGWFMVKDATREAMEQKIPFCTYYAAEKRYG